MVKQTIWPEGKHFAFTIFDDTDEATLGNVREIYSFLADCGFLTTKSVWAVGRSKNPMIGSTCEDQDYLDWLYEIKESGFEIGYHGSSFGSSLRNETIIGMERFKKLFGHTPRSFANHLGVATLSG